MKEIHERSELKYELLMQKKYLLLYLLFGCPRHLFLLKLAFIIYELEAE